MTDYDRLFDATRPANSVFADKSALDGLSEPEAIHGRTDQKEALASVLGGVHDGYLPTTLSIYGPPGTGKTVTTRRVTTEFVTRTDGVAVEYVNLKECRSIFSAANQIQLAVTGEQAGAYVGLDGVFENIWDALEGYPEWTILILDEVDQIQHDRNYDASEFFYRLLRGEGKLSRDIHLSAWLISNELLDVDLQLDSRVRSAMDGAEVFFPPYARAELAEILEPRVETAFVEGALPDAVLDRGVQEAAQRWGDARKGLRLFRRAGETANDRGLGHVTEDCLLASISGTEREATIEKLRALPLRHLAVLTASVSWRNGSGGIVQPVRLSRVQDRLATSEMAGRFDLGQRAVRELVDDLEMMGLVESWVEGHGGNGRARYMETTFDPAWVREAQAEVSEVLAG